MKDSLSVIRELLQNQHTKKYNRFFRTNIMRMSHPQRYINNYPPSHRILLKTENLQELTESTEMNCSKTIELPSWQNQLSQKYTEEDAVPDRKKNKRKIKGRACQQKIRNRESDLIRDWVDTTQSEGVKQKVDNSGKYKTIDNIVLCLVTYKGKEIEDLIEGYVRRSELNALAEVIAGNTNEMTEKAKQCFKREIDGDEQEKIKNLRRKVCNRLSAAYSRINKNMLLEEIKSKSGLSVENNEPPQSEVLIDKDLQSLNLEQVHTRLLEGILLNQEDNSEKIIDKSTDSIVQSKKLSASMQWDQDGIEQYISGLFEELNDTFNDIDEEPAIADSQASETATGSEVNNLPSLVTTNDDSGASSGVIAGSTETPVIIEEDCIDGSFDYVSELLGDGNVISPDMDIDCLTEDWPPDTGEMDEF